MRARSIALGALLALPMTAAAAQHAGGSGGAAATRPPREAAQYDFLVGEWTLTVVPRISGLVARIHGVPKLTGTWRAARALDGWGIEDELRIVDESGNPQAYTRFVRIYDPAARQWKVVSIEVYRQQIAQGTAQWTGSEMVTMGSGTDRDGKAYVTRTRIMRISAGGFRYQQDRSSDGGRTWDEARLVIDAKRVAAGAGAGAGTR